MAKVSTSISAQIKTLTKPELEKLVLKAASIDKSFHDFLLVNCFEKESAVQDLFEQAKQALDKLFRKNYKGFVAQEYHANMMIACTKCIADFSKTCKQKNLEADLIVHTLAVPFSLPENAFGTCFTSFDYRVGILMKKLTDLVTKKMHEVYRMEYREKVNAWLTILHRHSDHVSVIHNLPKEI